jgi:rubredoxin
MITKLLQKICKHDWKKIESNVMDELYYDDQELFPTGRHFELIENTYKCKKCELTKKLKITRFKE